MLRWVTLGYRSTCSTLTVEGDGGRGAYLGAISSPLFLGTAISPSDLIYIAKTKLVRGTLHGMGYNKATILSARERHVLHRQHGFILMVI